MLLPRLLLVLLLAVVSVTHADVSHMDVDASGETIDNSKAAVYATQCRSAFGTLLSQAVLHIHHNGVAQECGTISHPTESVLLEHALDFSVPHLCPSDNHLSGMASQTKFQTEAFLTHLVSKHLDDKKEEHSCGTTEAPSSSFASFCDMGELKTVVQHDYDRLQRLPDTNTLPCRFYTRTGQRITSLAMLNDVLEKEVSKCSKEDISCQTHPPLHLYAAPAGRMFMFAPSYIGEKFVLDHITDPSMVDEDVDPIVVETLNLEPRVFDVFHFFSNDEGDDLIQKALAEQDETYKFHRSTTGTTGSNVYNKRTSENAWDTMGTTAQRVKKRGFAVLGIDEYVESMSDGLQILRYNLTTAYVPHMDYLEDRAKASTYDYDSGGAGGNRFATILVRSKALYAWLVGWLF